MRELPEGFALTLCEAEHLSQLLPALSGERGRAIAAVEAHRRLQALQIRGALGASLQVLHHLEALRRIGILVEIFAELREDLLMDGGLRRHAVMYSFNSPRKKTRARRRRDFRAGMLTFNMSALSSADFPSISRRMK